MKKTCRRKTSTERRKKENKRRRDTAYPKINEYQTKCKVVTIIIECCLQLFCTPWVVPIFQRASKIRSNHDSRMYETVGQTRRGTVTNAKSNHVQSQVNAEIRKCFKNTTTTTHESTRRLGKLAHTRKDRKFTLSMCSLEA